AEHVLTAVAAAAIAAASGSMICSRRLIRNSAARRAERGPSPGNLARNWISVSSSDMTAAAKAKSLSALQGGEGGAHGGAVGGGGGYWRMRCNPPPHP